MLTRSEGGARPQCLPIRINEAANLGKFILLSPFCLFWRSCLALPQNVQLQGPEREVGGACTPWIIQSALKGLTCGRVVGSKPLGSWLPVRHAVVWALPGPWPLAPLPASILSQLSGEAISVTAWLPPSVQLALSCTSCGRLWTADHEVGPQQRWDRALSP